MNDTDPATSGAFDITRPSQRALAAWANQIQDHVQSFSDPCSLGTVTNAEVEAAYTKLRHEQGDAYVGVYFVTLTNLKQWDETLFSSDVYHLANLVTLARGMKELKTTLNTEHGDNDNGT